MIRKNDSGKSIFSILYSLAFPKKTPLFYSALDDLQQLYFSIYLNQDYDEHHFAYEKKIYFALQDALRGLKNVHEKQKLFDLVVSLGQLRMRTNEMATFEMMEQELKNVSETLSKVLHQRKDAHHEFAAAVLALEAIYQGPVETSAKDPVVFLIFIQALQKIEKVLNE